ncbi:MAG: M1 family metallopeptidase [Anaerolineaceae bacterium]|nr:M1 family metallopeptidase [Anaerolineaceae bacterium]
MKKTLLILVISLALVISACAPQQATLPPQAPAEVTAAPTQGESTTVPGPQTQVGPTTAPAGTAGEASIGDPYAPELGNTGYDVDHYTLRLSLDPEQTAISGHATIQAVSTIDQLDELTLDFTGFEIDQITSEPGGVSFSRPANKLQIDFPTPLAQGEAFTLEVTYHGTPTMEPSAYVPFVDSLGLQFDAETSTIYVVAEPDGAHYWFPCNDHPQDKATFRFELTVPEGQVGVANGSLVDTRTEVQNAFPDGRPGDLYIWEHNYPMAPYLATAAVGNYVRVESTSPGGVHLRSYVFPENQAYFENLSPTLGEMIDWMGAQFGPYPFEEFGYVQVNGLGASLETQTMVILSVSSGESTMAHELSHMWFGDWVSLDSWGEIWRNEGMATYVTQMWEARNNPDGLEQALQDWEQDIEANPSGYPLGSPPKMEMFGRDSYYKGAVVFHALRTEIGDQAFFQGVQTYLQRYGGGSASDPQFQEVMEEASGKSLDNFFEAWFE